MFPCAHVWAFMRRSMCLFMPVCFCLYRTCPPERTGKSHLQSKGSLIDWAKPPDNARTEWKLNKITVIYSTGNGDLSGGSGVADLCLATQIQVEMPNILHIASLRWETPDALQLQQINQSTYFQLFHLSTCCLPAQWFLRGLCLGQTHWVCTAQACLSTSNTS